MQGLSCFSENLSVNVDWAERDLLCPISRAWN